MSNRAQRIHRRVSATDLPAKAPASARFADRVLARAEVHASYQPARRLWVRTRNGHYFPNPQMQLRAGEGWQPVYERLALDWIDRGCGREIDHRPRPSESIRWVCDALVRAAKRDPSAADPDAPQQSF